MGPQYTKCVDESNYSELSYARIGLLLAITTGAGIFALLSISFSLVAVAALLEALRYVLDWLVNGKLICLNRKVSTDCVCSGSAGVCAIGEIVDTENVGQDKNPIEDIDDDYAINLALFPFDMAEFANRGFVEPGKRLRGTKLAYTDSFRTFLQSVMAVATQPSRPQADLLTRSLSVHGEVTEFGYLRTMVMHDDGSYVPWTNIVGRDSGTPSPAMLTDASADDLRWVEYQAAQKNLNPRKFSVPVLHCEFEGSRTRDMLAALEWFPFGSSYCKKNWFTKLVCRVLSAVFAPIALAAVLLAWLRNTEGSTNGALVDGGTIGPTNRVIVRGSWVYDSGHQGWNEIHAVRIVQRVENVPTDPAGFKLFLQTWCDVLHETPVTERPNPSPFPIGVALPQSSPAAAATLDAQGRPENQWECHPLIDGCQPVDRQPPPPPDFPPLH